MICISALTFFSWASPYTKFTVRKQEHIYRGHESCLSNWPDLSDPIVYLFTDIKKYKLIIISHFRIVNCFVRLTDMDQKSCILHMNQYSDQLSPRWSFPPLSFLLFSYRNLKLSIIYHICVFTESVLQFSKVNNKIST